MAAETVRRVRDAAHALGYRPDPTARSLRTRRSGFVGVVVPDLTNPVIPPIVRGIEEVLWTAGLACLLADTDNDARARGGGRRGAALAPLRGPDRRVGDALRARRVARARREDVATVLVTRDIDAGTLPLVAADDAAGVRAAVTHLAELGHERIAHVTGPLCCRPRRAAWPRSGRGAARRPRGRRSCTARPSRSRPASAPPPSCCGTHGGVTAILAGNDMIALGCYDALAAAGLRCPRRRLGRRPQRHAARRQRPAAAHDGRDPAVRDRREAARLLLARLRGGDGEQPPPRVLLPTRLVVRASTAPPPPARGR